MKGGWQLKKEYKTSTTLKRGQEYTFSVETSLPNAEVDVYIGLDYFIGRTVGQKITFEISRVVTSRNLIVDTGSRGNIIERVKLEKGSKATDWTPAPEDDREYINSQIEISAESIKSTVSSDVNSKFSYVNQRVDSITSVVAGKASSTRVSQLENSWAVRYLNNRDEVVSEINLSKDGVLVSGSDITLNGYTTVKDDFNVKGRIDGVGITSRGLYNGITLTSDGEIVFTRRNTVGGFDREIGWIYPRPSPESANNTDLYIRTGTRLRTNSIASTGDIRPDSDDYGNTNNDKLWLGNKGNRWHTLMLGSGGIDESSDIRLKKDIRDIPPALIEEFKNVFPREFMMNERMQFGYIAQEVESALFRYVTKEYGVEEARKNEAIFNMISKDESYLGLVYRQVEAIKTAEQMQEIRELKSRVEVLENERRQRR